MDLDFNNNGNGLTFVSLMNYPHHRYPPVYFCEESGIPPYVLISDLSHNEKLGLVDFDYAYISPVDVLPFNAISLSDYVLFKGGALTLMGSVKGNRPSMFLPSSLPDGFSVLMTCVNNSSHKV